MSTVQASVTEVAQCPLYRLLVAERQSLDGAINRLTSTDDPGYEPLNARSRAAGMVQHSICHRRARGGEPRLGSLALIEAAVEQLPEEERKYIIESLASCLAGCALKG